MKADPLVAADRIKGLIEPLLQGQFSSGLGKVLVYVQSVTRSLDSSRAALRALEEKRTGSLDADQDDWEKRRAAIEQAYNRDLKNSIAFARRNLDSAQLQALEELVRRPRLASKADLEKRALALQKSFDRMEDPAAGMLEHYTSTSDPLNKYLVAGPWGHEYLRKRKIDPGEYNLALCRLLGCQDTVAGRVVMSYASICQAIDELEAVAQGALD